MASVNRERDDSQGLCNRFQNRTGSGSKGSLTTSTPSYPTDIKSTGGDISHVRKISSGNLS